ncbi:DNA replication protein DnaC [Clostridia bacterium]|nr:DNA replication protein DnaC [Clostridia bacterium]
MQTRYSDSAVESALRELARRRDKNEDKQKKLVAEIYTKCPDVKAKVDEIHAMQTAAMRKLIDKKDASKEKKKVLELGLEKEKLLEKHGYSAEAFAPIYTCEKCHDTGVVWNKNHYCECRKELIAKAAARESGFADMDLPDWSEFDLALYDDTLAKKGKTCRQIAEMIKKRAEKFTKGNVCITGGVGLGKTFTAECIAGDWSRKGRTVCYLSSTRLFMLLDEKTFSKNTSQEVEQKVKLVYDADLLVIDDLGAEFRSSFTESMLFDIINSRLRENKATIISTNMGTQDIRDTYSSRVSSRIIGNYEWWEFSGDDIRFKLKGKKK